MKRKDKRLIGITAALTISLFLLFWIVKGKEGGTVVVTIDGEPYGRYDLLTEQTIKIEEGNTFRILNGTVDMTEATCPDQVCVRQMKISRNGETIVCLPHKLVIEIHSKTDSDVDAMAE